MQPVTYRVAWVLRPMCRALRGTVYARKSSRVLVSRGMGLFKVSRGSAAVAARCAGRCGSVSGSGGSPPGGL